MAIESVLSTAVSGLLLHSRRAASSADAIANVNTPGYRRTSVEGVDRVPGGVGAVERTGAEGVDLTQEFIGLIQAEIGYTANAQVIRTGEDLSRTLIDILA